MENMELDKQTTKCPDSVTAVKSEFPLGTRGGKEGTRAKVCAVCAEAAAGVYFGALVCLPCKSFYIRSTKDGPNPRFTCEFGGHCEINKQSRLRCQHCRFEKCLTARMCRKEKPEFIQPVEGQQLCRVCSDIANGVHFGVPTCEGCKKFFRRALREADTYYCSHGRDCAITPRSRNICKSCRYQKCRNVGMSTEAIRMGRPKRANQTEFSPVADACKTLQRFQKQIDESKQHTSDIAHVSTEQHSGDHIQTNQHTTNATAKTCTDQENNGVAFNKSVTQTEPSSVLESDSDIHGTHTNLPEIGLDEMEEFLKAIEDRQYSVALKENMQTIMERTARYRDGYIDVEHQKLESLVTGAVEMNPSTESAGGADPQQHPGSGDVSDRNKPHTALCREWRCPSVSQHADKDSDGVCFSAAHPSWDAPSNHSSQHHGNTTMVHQPIGMTSHSGSTTTLQNANQSFDIDMESSVLANNGTDEMAVIKQHTTHKRITSSGSCPNTSRNCVCWKSDQQETLFDQGEKLNTVGLTHMHHRNIDPELSNNSVVNTNPTKKFRPDYWTTKIDMTNVSVLKQEHATLISKLEEGYKYMTREADESKHSTDSKAETMSWMDVVKKRIITNLKASMVYARQIPGFPDLRASDQFHLCRFGGFHMMIILASREQFDPKERSFKFFWNTPLPPSHPSYSFREELMRYGMELHSMKMDLKEAACLGALAMVAPDWENLQDRTAVKDVSDSIQRALFAYVLDKHGETIGEGRLVEMMSIMPRLRQASVYHGQQHCKALKFNFDEMDLSKVFNDINITK